MSAFIKLPTGEHDVVAINIEEIAAYRSHTVTTAIRYEQWTKITLKSGVEHDCRIGLDDFEDRVHAADVKALGVEP